MLKKKNFMEGANKHLKDIQNAVTLNVNINLACLETQGNQTWRPFTLKYHRKLTHPGLERKL